MALRTFLGTLVNLLNSGLTMLVYVFMPQWLGLSHVEFFLNSNIYPSILVLVFSVGIPNYIKESEEVSLIILLFFLSSAAYIYSENFLWFSNLFWLLLGVMSQKELYHGRFYTYISLVLGLSLTNVLLVFCTSDWRLSHLLSPLVVLLIYIIVLNKMRIVNLLDSKINFKINSISNLFRKILSVSLLWWVITWRYNLEDASLYDLSVYQKVTLSIPVAVLSFVSLINFLNDSLRWGWKKDFLALIVSFVIAIIIHMYLYNISWILLTLLIFSHIPIVYFQNKLFEERFYVVSYIFTFLFLLFLEWKYLLHALISYLILIRIYLYVKSWRGITSLQRSGEN